jgi:hypothetical protein
MKKFILVLLVLVSFSGFSQKVKLKKGEILIDEVVWMNYQDCGAFDETCSILNKNKDEVIFFKWVKVKGGEPRTASNPEGNLTYIEVKFLGLNKFFEVLRTQKDVISMLYNGRVINAEGELDEEKVARMVEKYGTEFSNRLNQSNNNNSTQTIIIKEEPRRSGININLGR